MNPMVELDLSAMERMASSFEAGTSKQIDVYRAEAARVFNISEAEVTKQQREYVKAEMFYHRYKGR